MGFLTNPHGFREVSFRQVETLGRLKVGLADEPHARGMDIHELPVRSYARWFWQQELFQGKFTTCKLDHSRKKMVSDFEAILDKTRCVSLELKGIKVREFY